MLLKATDLDLEVTEKLAADVGSAGGTTLPAHTLYDIVRKLPDGAQVSLETTGETGQLQLRSGRSRFNLQTLPDSDFPDLAAGEFAHAFALPAGELKRLIDKTQFAISNEETRYTSTASSCTRPRSRAGPCCGRSRPTATGSRGSNPGAKGANGMPGVIVPRKAVAEVQKLVEDLSDESASISATKIR